MLYQCTLTTEHFTFESYGTTQEDAEDNMRRVLQKHADDYIVEANWYLPYWEDKCTRPLKFGVGYRDGEIIYER